MTRPLVRLALARACGDQPYVAQAPIVCVFCADPARSAVSQGARGASLYCIQDATIACAYAQLAATALGLGSVWVGSIFEPESIRDTLGLRAEERPVALLPLGYPAETPRPTSRRLLRDLVRVID